MKVFGELSCCTQKMGTLVQKMGTLVQIQLDIEKGKE